MTVIKSLKSTQSFLQHGEILMILVRQLIQEFSLHPKLHGLRTFYDCIIIKQFYGAKRSISHDSSSIFEYKNRS